MFGISCASLNTKGELCFMGSKVAVLSIFQAWGLTVGVRHDCCFLEARSCLAPQQALTRVSSKCSISLR